jgi:hypothetical protein
VESEGDMQVNHATRILVGLRKFDPLEERMQFALIKINMFRRCA